MPSDVWPGAEDPPYPAVARRRRLRGRAGVDGGAVASAICCARCARRGFAATAARRAHRVAQRVGPRRAADARRAAAPDQISGQDLRVAVGRTLGWQHIKSTAFELRRRATGIASAATARATASACASSARRALRRAAGRRPTSCRGIFRAHRSRARRVVVAAAPAVAPAVDVLVSLPAGDEGERDVIRDLALRARDRLARQLGVAVPPRIALRFHPTVESYQRASGQPWFTAGATVNTEMHFVPLTVLRDRGVLEKTVAARAGPSPHRARRSPAVLSGCGKAPRRISPASAHRTRTRQAASPGQARASRARPMTSCCGRCLPAR